MQQPDDIEYPFSATTKCQDLEIHQSMNLER